MIKDKVFVSIYCKIFTDSFSDEMDGVMTTGSEIYGFLMKDSGHCFDNQGNTIPGDSNIWYLGCNEKFGCLVYENNVSSWGFGEASFERVKAFVDVIYQDGLFTEEQHHDLIEKIKEGSRIGQMKNIGNYLMKKERRSRLRERAKTMISRAGIHLEGKSAL